MTKKRIDILLVEKGLAESRTKAQAYLLSGQVIVFGKRVDKAGTLIDEGSEVEVKERFPYVSRGALKLQKAYEEFGFDFKDKVICDIGSSTGGFTDFALARGAKKVYAIDVGYGQLDQKLRENSRVVVMEKTNIKELDNWEKFSKHVILATGRRPELDSGQARMTNEMTVDPIDFFVIDVSFISLKKVLPVVKKLANSCHSRSHLSFPRRRESISEIDPRVKPEDDKCGIVNIIALIKPQFEVGKKIADKYKGVVKDKKIHSEVVEDIAKFAEDAGFQVKGLAESPITGAKGNKEFLIHLVIPAEAGTQKS